MDELTLAVLITCHNRRDATVKCLQRLFEQSTLGSCKIRIYVVDDGSSDGTCEAVLNNFPDVSVLQGDGNLYWNGGMRLAWEAALKEDYDYYLWLNDDTELYAGALNVLLQTASEVRQLEGRDAIIVGSTCDPDTGEPTYGGVVRLQHVFAVGFRRMLPADRPQQCDTMNGNCVLIPMEVVQKVGNLSPDFTHGLGDYDYGLRAKQNGFSCWVAPGCIGTCKRNSTAGAWFDPELSLQERIIKLNSPKGLPPKEWLLFVKRHGGRLHKMIAWLKLNLRLLFPRVWRKLQNIKPSDIQ